MKLDRVYRESEGEFLFVGYCRDCPRSLVGESGQYVGPLFEDDILIPNEGGEHDGAGARKCDL